MKIGGVYRVKGVFFFRVTSPDTVVLTEEPYVNQTFTEYMRNIVRFPDAATMKKYQEALVTGQAIEYCQSGYNITPRVSFFFFYSNLWYVNCIFLV